MFYKSLLVSPSNCSEKRYSNSNTIGTRMSLQNLIENCKLEDLKTFLMERKNIEPKLVEDGIISILKNKTKPINIEILEMLIKYIN